MENVKDGVIKTAEEVVGQSIRIKMNMCFDQECENEIRQRKKEHRGRKNGPY